ncbi:T9SS C-terminal target domain-containing protein [Chryseobacterium arthrosphaerae]|uniref:T9SS type A sorting domain-containing protein n=1 Tax=Chryseobacterium arthrosphaerae TaxID=651561 RepID=UPI000F4E189D|nr:T9SS type A sorting domain-containing protein [Chryseobacterium arthrosphaerae]AYZ14209.1 T9SS C-terminal target domain-containing protein [Chryseobacterium arthrosphaerae]
MIEDLYFTIRKLGAGIMLVLIAGHALQAQGSGTPQNCNNADPGNNTGDTGCVNFTYRGQPVTYTTVRAGDGNIWLQQNLGSLQVAGMADDEKAYGDFFQWGRWDDGHQLRNSPLTSAPQVNAPDGLAGTPSFITGSPAWWEVNATTDAWAGKDVTEITNTTGVDPCKAIGPDWRMPSQVEWKTIVSVESITSPSKAYGSSLKLPAAGSRSHVDGTFSFVGKRGYYWSSDPTGIGAKYLYIGATISNAAAGAPKGQGASVRCIKPAASLSTSEIRLKKQVAELYPNPVKDILGITAGSYIETVNVVNAAGQKMKVELSNNSINMSGLNAGLYWVEIKLKNGEIISEKIIKN